MPDGRARLALASALANVHRAVMELESVASAIAGQLDGDARALVLVVFAACATVQPRVPPPQPTTQDAASVTMTHEHWVTPDWRSQ
jgi:hypothetical protein